MRSTGCSGKSAFFSQFTATPSLAYIAVRDLQSSQRNVSEQSTPIGWQFFVQPIAAGAGEGEVANFQEFFKKTQYLMNTLYHTKLLTFLTESVCHTYRMGRICRPF